MDNAFDEINRAINAAADLNRLVDHQANRIASLLAGRLRCVNTYTLKDLKRELSHFNARTGKWS